MAIVTAIVTGTVTPDGHRVCRLRVDLIFNTEDPYAVQLIAYTGAEKTVEWVFSGELLSEALRHPGQLVGYCDVHVAVKVGFAARQSRKIVVTLTSPEGEAHLTLPAPEVHDFVRRMQAASTSLVMDAVAETLAGEAEQFLIDRLT